MGTTGLEINNNQGEMFYHGFSSGYMKANDAI